MSQNEGHLAGPLPVVMPDRLPRLLIVDDSRLQRRLIQSSLKESGFELFEAGSAEEALEICRRTPPEIIVSDWVMPGLSGLEFCTEIRRLNHDRYIYFIILTSKSEKGELAYALSRGADDFLSKPVSPDELRSRISAGLRILSIERELIEKNRLISRTLDRMNEMHAALDRDLIEARKLQMSLVPRGTRFLGGAQIDFLFQPSGHVGGDLVGSFRAGPERIGVYALDVSGHGIASALITARLSAWMTGNTPDQNLALTRREGQIVMKDPAEICRQLNELCMSEIETEHYFTIAIAEIDLSARVARICQAGHPHPLLQRAGGQTEFLGSGGLPIGLLPDAEYTQFEVAFEAGDRLLLYSDGLTECPLRGGGCLEDTGLAAILERSRDVRGSDLIDRIKWDLGNLADDADLPDDVSAALLEFCA